MGPVGRVNRWTRNSEQRCENSYHKALAFSGHSIDLVFDEEDMKPEKRTEASKNAGIDPISMRVSPWYQEPFRENDDSHFPSATRVSDAFTGMDRTSYQVPQHMENDDEWLAMKRGDKPPPVPERVADPIIREDHAVQEFRSNSDKHGSIVADLPSHNL